MVIMQWRSTSRVSKVSNDSNDNNKNHRKQMQKKKNTLGKGGQIKYPMMLCAKISQVLFFITNNIRNNSYYIIFSHAKSVQTEIFQSWNIPE